MKRVGWALLALLLLAAAAAAGYWAYEQRRIALFARDPFGSDLVKVVEVPPGTGPKALASLLARQAVVKSAPDFYAYLRREQLGPKLKAGEYEFQGALTPAQVADKIVQGQVKVYRFTIPEGLRAEEILAIVAQSELKLDSRKLARLHEDRAFVRKVGVPPPAQNLEGFLFPDTYVFSRPFSEEAVLQKMVSRTLEEFRKADAHRDPSIRLNLLQTITLASIIEKETGAPEERPRISCVFHNRLRLKMKLQTDPTVLYAMRLMRGTFSKNITAKDLVTEHPYNTYTIPGLPPGPIASPGAAAIDAALNPLDCKDLFFVSNNNGTHIFCPDLKCHNAAVEQWQKRYWSHRPQ